MIKVILTITFTILILSTCGAYYLHDKDKKLRIQSQVIQCSINIKSKMDDIEELIGNNQYRDAELLVEKCGYALLQYGVSLEWIFSQSIPYSEYTLNAYFYRMLSTILPDNKIYSNKLSEYDPYNITASILTPVMVDGGEWLANKLEDIEMLIENCREDVTTQSEFNWCVKNIYKTADIKT